MNGNRPQANTERLTLNISEVARLLNISRGLAYRLARERKFPVIACGRRLLVPRHALERWLAEGDTPREEPDKW